jgi:hypothetical protein
VTSFVCHVVAGSQQTFRRITLPPYYSLVYSSTLKMQEETCFSETSVDFQRTTWRYNPEDRSLHNQRSENLRSYAKLFHFWVYAYIKLNEAPRPDRLYSRRRVATINVRSQHSPEESLGKTKKTFRITGLLIEIRTRNLPNMKQEY